jgi:nucleoside-diphosphate-sugar epimerase
MTRVMARRCAVIGATGFIGSHLAERLVAEGARVLAVARSERRRGNLAAVRSHVEFVTCDVMAGEALTHQLAPFAPDIVFYLADHPDGTEDFSQMRRAVVMNALGAVAALEAATSAGAELFVHGDSAKVYGNGPAPYRMNQPVQPICSYAIGKAAAWQLCQLARLAGGPAVVGLRPTLVYGPRQGMNLLEYVRRCIQAGHPTVLQGGHQTRDPLFVDDVVDAFVRAAVTPDARGLAIPVGGGHEISVLDLARAVMAALGSDGPVETSLGARPTEIWRCVADNTDAGSVLGWRPATSLQEGLAKTFGEARP